MSAPAVNCELTIQVGFHAGMHELSAFNLQLMTAIGENDLVCHCQYELQTVVLIPACSQYVRVTLQQGHGLQDITEQGSMCRYVLSRRLSNGAVRPVTDSELKTVRLAHGLGSTETSLQEADAAGEKEPATAAAKGAAAQSPAHHPAGAAAGAPTADVPIARVRKPADQHCRYSSPCGAVQR